MKPTGTYARNNNIASKMPVNMSYRPRLNAAGFMIASLRCQTVFPRTSGESTKCDRSTPPARGRPICALQQRQGQRLRSLGAAGAAHRRERLVEIPPRHHVFDVGGQFTPPVWILPIGARNVDRIDHPQKILDLQ